MWGLLARLHGLLFRGCLWLLRLPFAAAWALLLAVLALLGEEFRRYAGLAVSGLLIVLAGKAVLNYAPADIRQPLILADLLLLGIWALAVRRATRVTRANNLVKVRQRQAFKELRAEVRGVGGRVESIREGVARRARGTVAEGVFRSNRAKRAEEQQAALAAAELAEQERAEQAEWDRAVAVKRAERERFAAAAAERWANRRQGA